MQKLVSGRMDNHTEWLINEIAELEDAAIKHKFGSDQAIMEAFDVMAFLVGDCFEIKESDMERLFDASVLLLIRDIVQAHISTGAKGFYSYSNLYAMFHIWNKRKTEKYGEEEWRNRVPFAMLMTLAVPDVPVEDYVQAVYSARRRVEKYRAANDK